MGTPSSVGKAWVFPVCVGEPLMLIVMLIWSGCCMPCVVGVKYHVLGIASFPPGGGRLAGWDCWLLRREVGGPTGGGIALSRALTLPTCSSLPGIRYDAPSVALGICPGVTGMLAAVSPGLGGLDVWEVGVVGTSISSSSGGAVTIAPRLRRYQSQLSRSCTRRSNSPLTSQGMGGQSFIADGREGGTVGVQVAR